MKGKSIAILGIGGVGGFVAAKILANRSDKSVKLDLISRGATYDNIKSKGLVFSNPDSEEFLQSDGLFLTGECKNTYDVVILATKSQSLKHAILENQAIFGKETLVLPLQNMTNAAAFIRPLVGKAMVMDACIYLISNVQEPGHIKHLGGPGKVIVGSPKTDTYDWVFNYLNKCGIPLNLVPDVNLHLWRKFLFISSLGTLTAAKNVTFGEIRSNEVLKGVWIGLMEELIQLAQKQEVMLDDSDVQNALAMISNFPENAKSSFQLDIEAGKFGEKKTLVDEVIINSKKYGLSCANYQVLESKISERLGNN
ncbi:2-dehydropantoate 2-reductase N-terminal domain-containing protein [Cyclobacterium sp. 1_MG-2023]|uniref:ketopantoate reductase family protein n=1 Tax=Cyclobacterium sp. 1_MG-2023 TaxID=3062681 RepID=UPI0026E39CD5|nr:2-dehydropantoate 2-reductase N-terminal domain-containing protein [Cyclobacterium sp. 1_MG-2023]MDO6436903.1 2-dehydropantoate 2-reductase N-terminal domain-containing protein [Cyclobacterium sp. 1_MG-2023]